MKGKVDYLEAVRSFLKQGMWEVPLDDLTGMKRFFVASLRILSITLRNIRPMSAPFGHPRLPSSPSCPSCL